MHPQGINILIQRSAFNLNTWLEMANGVKALGQIGHGWINRGQPDPGAFAAGQVHLDRVSQIQIMWFKLTSRMRVGNFIQEFLSLASLCCTLGIGVQASSSRSVTLLSCAGSLWPLIDFVTAHNEREARDLESGWMMDASRARSSCCF